MKTICVKCGKKRTLHTYTYQTKNGGIVVIHNICSKCMKNYIKENK